MHARARPAAGGVLVQAADRVQWWRDHSTWVGGRLRRQTRGCPRRARRTWVALLANAETIGIIMRTPVPPSARRDRRAETWTGDASVAVASSYRCLSACGVFCVHSLESTDGLTRAR